MKTIYQLIERGTFPKHCGLFATAELAQKREFELRANRAGIADGAFRYYVVKELTFTQDQIDSLEIETR